jgi:hypothetical protein
VRARFAEALARHESAGLLRIEGERITLPRHALLQVDNLLHEFFPAEHRKVRYA